jgi:hypothetical protein
VTVTSYCSPSLAQPSPAERELVRYTLVTSERPTDRQPWPSACLEHTHSHCEPYQTACLDTLPPNSTPINRPARAPSPLARCRETRYSIVKPCEPSPLAPAPSTSPTSPPAASSDLFQPPDTPGKRKTHFHTLLTSGIRQPAASSCC